MARETTFSKSSSPTLAGRSDARVLPGFLLQHDFLEELLGESFLPDVLADLAGFLAVWSGDRENFPVDHIGPGIGPPVQLEMNRMSGHAKALLAAKPG